MKAGPVLAALVGFAGGVAVVVATLAMEIVARELPLRGGLLRLQMDSVAVWVLESMPFLLAGAAGAVAMAAAKPAAPPAPLPVQPLPVPPPPPPPPVTEAPATAPPLPESLQSADTTTSRGEGPPGGEGSSAEPQQPPGAAPPPVPDMLQGANLLGTAGTDHRVRALQELVRVLKENASRAADESRAKSSYLANMSHELRTPINAIIGYTEMLAEEAAESGLSLEPDLRRVAAAGRQLVELVNDILDLSKIEVGKLPIVLEDVDLAQVVDEVRATIAPMVSRNNNTFSARIVPGARFVRGDHMRIRQILVNLLANAFKFTQGGNVTLAIERAAPMRSSWIALRVRDTGQGLGPRELECVFDEYQQSTPRSDVPSTGLGLAISRKLAELMGGRLEAESEIGLGSEFSLILPPAQIQENEVPARSTVALNERLSGMRLLLVDSEPSGITLARYLERAGLRVELLADLESARVAASADPPAIAILSAGSKRTWSVAEELVGRGVKVVVVSLRDEDVESALQCGVTAFLVRPVERKLVLATLERCLEE